ncbi:hypothetical protein VCHENC02_0809B, partial [Vibrio harveyi]
ATNREFLF